MSRPYDLAGTGSMVVDLICSTPRFIGEDEKVLLEGRAPEPAVRRLVGGVTLNHLGWASLFGLRCCAFGKQADDDEGRFLRAGMARLGIEPAIDLSGSASSFAHVYVDGQGGRAIYMARGATGELTADEIDARHGGVIDSARLVSSEVSQVPLAAVERVLERAAAAGARTVVDLDVPLRDAVPRLGTERQLADVLERAHVIKASRGATAGLVPDGEPEAIAAELGRRYRAEIILLTLGADGALAWSDKEVLRVPAPAANVVDTTGAGDALLGGWLAGRHHDLDPADALILGVACAAACCERLGGFPDEPDACRARALELYQQAGGAPLPAEARPAPPKAPRETGNATARFLAVARQELARSAEDLDLAALRAAAERIRAAEAHGARVHVTGVGKPEHLAQYAASLLSSTGTPATFLHGTEATHGSVGQLVAGDVLIAISKSGETEELLSTVAAASALDVAIVAVTSRAASRLARAADVVLEVSSEQEGGPLGLAPRASFLAITLALQALSVELQASRDFTRADYHARHPHGTLGKLTTR